MEMKIGSYCVSNESPTFFIADIGANHDGNIERAKKLIKLAADSGANACKFQHFKADTIVSEVGFRDIQDILPDHQKSWDKTVIEVYKDAEFNLDWDEELYTYCNDLGVVYMTSPYSIELLGHIEKYVDTIKIGSGDISWKKMLEAAARTSKNILLATGASDIEDVLRAYNTLKKYNVPISIMQCNTNYTGKLDNYKYCNLNVLRCYRNLFPDAILGLSDHTQGHIAALGAVTLGARIVEKHFTDDNNRIGPDHSFAMNPESWFQMVHAVRMLEASLGDGIKKVEANEEKTYIAQRRSIYLSRALFKGDIISENDIECLRPQQPGAFQAWAFEDLIGREIIKDTPEGSCLFPGAVK